MATILLVLLMLIGLAAPWQGWACSICKVTVNGHTYLGGNEDSFRVGSRIWFEQGDALRLGCVYVGFGNWPQGGMNEAGLAFDAVATLAKPVRKEPVKKQISSPEEFLKEIMQTCETVDEVKQLVLQYNRQEAYRNGVLLFADRAGSYLVVEADTVISGNDKHYLLANFCPSIATEKEKLALNRYRNGQQFLKSHASDTSSGLCLALTDTMHQCQEKIGDGTMYSFVADLEKGNFTLCFYHDFRHPLTFNLQRELAKGNHGFQMAAIFPANAEYRRFLSFRTPQNDTSLLLFVFFSGGVSAFSTIFFLSSAVRAGRQSAQQKQDFTRKLLLAVLSVVVCYYITLLYRDQGAFYVPAPYKNFRLSVPGVAAFIPYLVLLLAVPLAQLSVKVFRSTSWGVFSKSLFALNSLVYCALIVLFAYWRFYQVF